MTRDPRYDILFEPVQIGSRAGPGEPLSPQYVFIDSIVGYRGPAPHALLFRDFYVLDRTPHSPRRTSQARLVPSRKSPRTRGPHAHVDTRDRPAAAG